MRFLKPVVTIALASLLGSAAYAESPKAPAAPVARSASPAPDSEALRGGFIIPAVAIIAIILGILAATSGGDDHHHPHSP